jgi:hypothetical protein
MMEFMVTIRLRDHIGWEEAKPIRAAIGQQIANLMGTGKVRESGFFTNDRRAFFILEVEAAEEFYELFGPEVYDNFNVTADPIAPVETVARLFQSWGQAGR